MIFVVGGSRANVRGRAAALFLAASLVATPSPACAQRSLTPEFAIETGRFLPFLGARKRTNPNGVVLVSPDGSRYITRVLRGDVEQNGVFLDILGGDISKHAVSPPRTLIRLFTSGLGPGGAEFFGPLLNLDQYWSEVRWLDAQHVSFFWQDANEIRQVVALNVQSGELSPLTNSPTHVTAYDVGPNGDVLFSAMARLPPASIPTDADGGIVISPGTDAFGLFRRDLSGVSLLDRRLNTEWFFQRSGSAEPRKIRVAGRDSELNAFHRIAFAPTGDAAILNIAPIDIPRNWDAYTDAMMNQMVRRARRDSREMFARLLQQLVVVNLDDGRSRTLWDVPVASMNTVAAWSPDGRYVLLAPTYLPVTAASDRGLRGEAAAVVNVRTGSYVELPITLSDMDFGTAVQWVSADLVEIRKPTGSLSCFQRTSSRWRLRECPTPRMDDIRFEVRDGPSEPPRLYAVGAREDVLLVDPNPGLTEQVPLGRVETLEGRVDDQVDWRGLIFLPPDYDPQRRYPVVIQSVYGEMLGENFTLYGSGEHIGPTSIAPYPGRILASRGMIVLHLNASVGAAGDTPSEPLLRMRVFEAAAQRMIDVGFADPTKIGLLGFSRNGWYVEYTLTHSDFPFAAALIADNFDPSYVPSLLMNQETTNSTVMGAEPFGTGMSNWLSSAPGFNAYRVRTPLRIVEQSFSLWGAFLKWELFSRMRHLSSPVEFYLMPMPERGAHNPQNPQQILAVQHGSIDWFNFWLSGIEDPNPNKADQYVRWRRLHEHYKTLLQTPRPPLLQWKATSEP